MTQQEQIRQANPSDVLDVYLKPTLEELPGLPGDKDTFPKPHGIGQLDPVWGCCFDMA